MTAWDQVRLWMFLHPRLTGKWHVCNLLHDSMTSLHKPQIIYPPYYYLVIISSWSTQTIAELAFNYTEHCANHKWSLNKSFLCWLHMIQISPLMLSISYCGSLLKFLGNAWKWVAPSIIRTLHVSGRGDLQVFGGLDKWI